MTENDPDSGAAPCPRWRRRPAERRREIIEAAVRVFGERGYDCATMADVARRAGVSPATVAHYFGSKGDLFEATLTDRFLEGVVEGEALLAVHHGTYRELLTALLTRMWRQLMRPGTADLLLFGLAKAQSFPDAAGIMCRGVGERWRRLVGDVLRAGIERGEFRPVDVTLTARVVGSGLGGLALSAHHFAPFEPVAIEPEALLAGYLEMIERALAAGPELRTAPPTSSGPPTFAAEGL